ncbi:hypothetical protein AMJ80_05590 [bacterium SM23_31]|nr:MAG: hypothetical protein AMJ80_05590 [bacterium SM23_31]
MKPFNIEISNLSKNCNEALILAILSEEKKHGYQIALEVEERSGGMFKFNHGTLYPILHKLEKDGLVTGTWEEESIKRKRKYYSLSNKGKEYLAGQQAGWQNFFRAFFEIMGKGIR